MTLESMHIRKGKVFIINSFHYVMKKEFKYLFSVAMLFTIFILSGCYIDGDVGMLSENVFDFSFGNSIYDFNVQSIESIDVPMSLFKGDVMLIVNVASECGLTYQYEGFQNLYNDYAMYDFVILGFPSNQFGNQEPGTNEEILEFCTSVFNVTFPMFSKIDVKGENQSLLFSYLVDNAPYNETGIDIEWNFAKFLIDREGNIYKRYHPTVEPEDLREDIEFLLGLD